MKIKGFRKGIVLVGFLFLAAGMSARSTHAQDIQQRLAGPVLVPGIGLCSTTNPTDVAAKSLGMQSAALRAALVSGKSLAQLATSRNIPLKTVTDALEAANKADLDQAFKDGLISQEQYKLFSEPNAMNTVPGIINVEGAMPTVPLPPGSSGSVQVIGTAYSAQPMVPDHNLVNRETVAAKALGISCPELIKATRNGQSIAELAVSKNTPLQTVIDTLVNASKDAIAADVKEGLTSQAQADGQNARLINEVLRYIAGEPVNGPLSGVVMAGGIDCFGVGAMSGFGGFSVQPGNPGTIIQTAPPPNATPVR